MKVEPCIGEGWCCIFTCYSSQRVEFMNSYFIEFITIALVHFLAVASPGPDFAITLRQSVCYGRQSGLWTSVGIGLGILVHVAYCILGLGILISKSILAFNMVKYAGALYLMYIGVCALRSKPQEKLPELSSSAECSTAYRSFVIGFITNALNPKATLFFLAVFSVTVSPNTPILLKIGYGLWMAFATTVWFGALSIFFSKRSVRSLFQKFGHWFERSMGAILIALGIKLALTPSK